jgi:hypothetical protein
MTVTKRIATTPRPSAASHCVTQGHPLASISQGGAGVPAHQAAGVARVAHREPGLAPVPTAARGPTATQAARARGGTGWGRCMGPGQQLRPDTRQGPQVPHNGLGEVCRQPTKPNNGSRGASRQDTNTQTASLPPWRIKRRPADTPTGSAVWWRGSQGLRQHSPRTWIEQPGVRGVHRPYRPLALLEHDKAHSTILGLPILLPQRGEHALHEPPQRTPD